jgi:hypothetical protein
MTDVNRFLLGVDLAKSLDFTSFAIIHMAWDRSIMDFRYHLKGLDRIRGVNYPQIVDLIINTVERLKKERNIEKRIKNNLDSLKMKIYFI